LNCLDHSPVVLSLDLPDADANKAELHTAQALYDKFLCIFPDCTAPSATAPAKQRSNLDQHIRMFSDHNTAEANAYKLRLIGNLTQKRYSKTKLVSRNLFL
jgi:hypothetical protein